MCMDSFVECCGADELLYRCVVVSHLCAKSAGVQVVLIFVGARINYYGGL